MLKMMSGRLQVGFWGLILLSLLAVVGCGDNGSDINEVSGVQGGGGNNGALVGNFLGSSNVGANQRGILNLNVNNAGAATGTLQVLGVNAQTVNVGSFTVSGSANRFSGAFTVSGTIPPLGAFTITGTLGNPGSYTLTFNGNTFNGVIQPAASGTPSPSPSPTNTPTSRLILGGSVSNFVFTPNGAYNGDQPPISANAIVSGAVGTGTGGQSTASIVLTDINVGEVTTSRLFSFTVVDPSGDPIEAGNVYPLATGSPADGSAFAYSTVVGTTPTEGYSIVAGTTGQITIVSINATSIVIDYTFTNVGPNSAITNNPSLGTFSTSGRITGNFAPTV